MYFCLNELSEISYFVIARTRHGYSVSVPAFVWHLLCYSVKWEFPNEVWSLFSIVDGGHVVMQCFLRCCCWIEQVFELSFIFVTYNFIGFSIFELQFVICMTLRVDSDPFYISRCRRDEGGRWFDPMHLGSCQSDWRSNNWEFTVLWIFCYLSHLYYSSIPLCLESTGFLGVRIMALMKVLENSAMTWI